MRTALLLLTLLPVTVQAYTPPPYVAGQQVYRVPDDTSVVTGQTELAVTETEHPVVVVFANNVVDNERDAQWTSDTEDAIEDTWALWTQDPDFQADITSVVLIGMDEREIRILTGSTWDADLGLTGSALSRLTEEHFVPQARAGNLDLAAQRTVVALDAEITRRIEWEAGAEERARAAERGRLAREARMAQLDERRREAEAQLAVERAEFRRKLRFGSTVAGIGLLGFAILGAAGVFAARRRRRRQESLALLNLAIATMTERLARATDLVADLRLQSDARDGVLALRIKGPDTNRLLDAVTGALDHIQVRLNAMRHHLDRIASKAASAGAFNAAFLDALAEELQTGFTYEPDAQRDKLFAASAPIRVDFPTFEAELQIRYDEAKAGWTRLLDAVDASLRRASDDLPLDGLQQAIGLVEALGVPYGWVESHPLYNDADAAMAELDAMRISDPVHYLDVLDNIHAAEDALIDALQAIQEDRNAVLLARNHATSLTTPSDVVLEEEQSPEEAIALAEDATEIFEAHIRSVSDQAVVAAAGDEAIDAWNEVTARHERIVEAVQTLPTRLKTATAEIAALAARREHELTEISRLSEHHKNLAAATHEMTQASIDVNEAIDALRDAHAAHNRKALVTALGAVELAVAEQEEALEDLQELRVITQALVRKREEAVTLWDSLDALRAKMVADLGALAIKGPRAEKVLRAGDAAHDALRREWDHAADWMVRADRVQHIRAEWRAAVSKERERIDKAIEADLARSRRRRRTSSGFWGSTSSRSSSRSSGRSWSSRSSSSRSSRSRSSRSSYSSSRSRSGGSSYKSSGGRSGGSKW